MSAIFIFFSSVSGSRAAEGMERYALGLPRSGDGEFLRYFLKPLDCLR